MKIDAFCAAHGDTTCRPIETLAERWEREAELDRLLNTAAGGGMVLGDLMIGDGLRDQVSRDLFEAFHALMGEKAGSFAQVREILLARLEDGPAAVFGMVNKIKGQVGENWFIEEAAALGASARLADLGNQEGWDVAVAQADGATRYVQVKMYQDPAGIVEKIREVDAKLQTSGRITDGDRAVEAIDFAIPAETVKPVQERLDALGLDTRLLPMEGTAEQAGDVVHAGFAHVGPEALEHLFSELLGVTAGAAVLHGVVNSFQVYKGSKQAAAFLDDTATETGLTVAGIASGMSLEAALGKIAWIGGAPTFALVLTTSITTRSILRRVLSRRDDVSWLREKNRELRAAPVVMT